MYILYSRQKYLSLQIEKLGWNKGRLRYFILGNKMSILLFKNFFLMYF